MFGHLKHYLQFPHCTRYKQKCLINFNVAIHIVQTKMFIHIILCWVDIVILRYLSVKLDVMCGPVVVFKSTELPR